MNILRRKRKRERKVHMVSEQSRELLKKTPTLEQLSQLATGHVVMIQLYKEVYFNPTVMRAVNLSHDKEQRIGVLVDRYLRATLALTYAGMGPVSEPFLEWILLDTPLSREAFCLIKDRYRKYFEK